MITRLFGWFVPVIALAACAAGTTVRAGGSDDTRPENRPAVDPAPEAEPRSAPPPSQPAPQTGSQPESGAAPVQGYAPYGNTQMLDIRRVGQWTRTGIGEARSLVIRDANAWDQFWSELGVGARPDVDFTRDIVVAVAAGQRPSGGYEIEVERVTRSDGELNVHVVDRTPGPNCMTSASLTQPVDVIVVSAADARSWRFLERKEIRGCR